MSRQPPFEFTCFEISSIAPDNLKAICAYAKRFNIRAIGLMHIDWDKYHLLDYSKPWGIRFADSEAEQFTRDLQAKIAKASETVSAQGLEFFLWHHEIKLPIGFLDKMGKEFLRFENPRLWEFVQWKLETLFTLFPNVKGVFFTGTGERMPGTGITLDGADSGGTFAERMEKMYSVIVSVCEKFGRVCVLRSHGIGDEAVRLIPREGDFISSYLRAVKPFAGRAYIMGKGVEPDYQATYPLNLPLAAMTAQQPTLMELSLPMEYNGVGRVPFTMPEDIQFRIQSALDMGCKGVVARADWHGCGHQVDQTFACLGSLNELNLFAFARLVNEPNLPIDRLLNEFAEERYGKQAVEPVVAIFRDLYEAGCKSHYELGLRCTGPHNVTGAFYPPERCLDFVRRFPLHRWSFSPVDYAAYQRALNPDAHFIARVRQEKDEAIAIYHRAIEILRKNRQQFSKTQSNQLERGFMRASQETALRRDYAAAFFHWVAYTLWGREEDRNAIRGLLNALHPQIKEFSELYNEPDAQTCYGENMMFGKDAEEAVRAMEQALREVDQYWSTCGIWPEEARDVVSMTEPGGFEFLSDPLKLRLNVTTMRLQSIAVGDKAVIADSEATDLLRIHWSGLVYQGRHDFPFIRHCLFKYVEGRRVDLRFSSLVLTLTFSPAFPAVLVGVTDLNVASGKEIVLPWITPRMAGGEIQPQPGVISTLTGLFGVTARAAQPARAFRLAEGNVTLVDVEQPGCSPVAGRPQMTWTLQEGRQAAMIIGMERKTG